MKRRRVEPTSTATIIAVIAAGFLTFLLVGAAPAREALVTRAIAAGAVLGLGTRLKTDRAWVLAGAGAVALAGGLITAVWSEDPGGVPAMAPYLLAAPVVAAVVALACAELRLRFDAKWAAAVALVAVCGVYLNTVGVLPGPTHEYVASERAALAVEPEAEGYAFDGMLFIRTSFLVDQGVPYYEAFSTAYNEDQRLEGSPPGLLNFRQPWLYYLWRVLPGQSGTKVWDWFVVLGLGTALTVFWGLREPVGDALALAGTAATFGYVGYGALTSWFSISEYWAGCVAVCAVMAMLRKKPYLAAALVAVAFSMRELVAWLIPVYAVWWFVSEERKKWLPALGIAVLGPIALFAAHAVMSPVHSQASQGVSFWLQASLSTFLSAVQFSGRMVPYSEWLYPLLALTAVVGLALAKGRTWRATAIAAVAAPLLLLGLFSNGQWGDYWGAVGMITVLPLAILAIGAAPGVSTAVARAPR